MEKILMFTDGSCLGNPGAGGWCAILRLEDGTDEVVLKGGEKETTNNRMELTAVLNGFKDLLKPCKVVLTSDSKYVLDALSKGWAVNWKHKGWRRSDGKPALNSDLWDELLSEVSKHEVEYVWIKGHAGHPENERCDALAVAEAEKIQRSKTATKVSPIQDIETCKCDCGGTIGDYSSDAYICNRFGSYSKGTYICNECGKVFLLRDIEYDHLIINEKTGWIFPVVCK